MRVMLKVEVICLLLDRGTGVDVTSDVRGILLQHLHFLHHYSACTSLHIAAKYGHDTLMKLLFFY